MEVICGCLDQEDTSQLDNHFGRFPIEFSFCQLTSKCSVCCKSGVKLKLCGRCKLVEYCSKACQLSDWKLSHKRLCPLMPACPVKWSPSPNQVKILQLQIMTSRGLVTSTEYTSSWLNWLQMYVLYIMYNIWMRYHA